MVENPNAQTSDILEYMDFLDGYLEPYVVDDDYVEYQDLART